MLGLSVSLLGLNSVKKQLSNLVNDEKIEAILEKAAIEINNEAKILCPVRTGNLRASITYVHLKKFLWGVGTNVEYAPYVEFGTYKMRAQPYLRPAFDKVATKYKISGRLVLG